MRVKQRSDGKGSLKWMQSLVATGGIDIAFVEELHLQPGVTIDWRSPLASDDFAEYRDESFLRLIGHESLAPHLRRFWPQQGPQWDGLAVSSDGKVILVEAKAHVGELVSSCTAGQDSLELINQSLQEAKVHYGAHPAADWTTGFYQYANRLAHLKFLLDNGVDAHLVFIYFLNAWDMGRTSLAEWANVLDDCYDRLGLARERKDPHIHSLYVNVDREKNSAAAG
jgi:hypothetical protein